MHLFNLLPDFEEVEILVLSVDALDEFEQEALAEGLAIWLANLDGHDEGSIWDQMWQWTHGEGTTADLIPTILRGTYSCECGATYLNPECNR